MSHFYTVKIRFGSNLKHLTTKLQENRNILSVISTDREISILPPLINHKLPQARA